MRQEQVPTQRALWMLTGDLFRAISQLRSLKDAAPPDPDALYRGFRRQIDRFCIQAASHGIDTQDIHDIQYALVALCDEAALTLGGAVRDRFLQNLLQVFYFRENVAGEGFFDRLETLRRGRRTVAMEAYYLCLLHGFRGRYSVHGKELELHDLVEELGAELKRLEAATPGPLSPEGKRPSESIVQTRTHRGLIFYGLMALGLSLAIYFGMRIDLRVRVADVVESLEEGY